MKLRGRDVFPKVDLSLPEYAKYKSYDDFWGDINRRKTIRIKRNKRKKKQAAAKRKHRKEVLRGFRNKSLERAKQKKELKRQKQIIQRKTERRERTLKKPKYVVGTIINGKLKILKEYDTNLDTALIQYESLLRESNDVIFPLHYMNTNNEIILAEREIVLLYRLKEHELGQNYTTLLKNNIKVPHKMSQLYTIHARYRYDIEETFWIYRYNPKRIRPTFNECFDIFLEVLSETTDIAKLYIYKNKVVLKNDDIFEMVICKNKNDAYRFYGAMSKKLREEKCNLFYLNEILAREHSVIDELMDATGWNRKKITRNNTRP